MRFLTVRFLLNLRRLLIVLDPALVLNRFPYFAMVCLPFSE